MDHHGIKTQLVTVVAAPLRVTTLSCYTAGLIPSVVTPQLQHRVVTVGCCTAVLHCCAALLCCTAVLCCVVAFLLWFCFGTLFEL